MITATSVKQAPEQAKLTLTGIKKGVPVMEPNSRGLASSV